MKPILQNQTCIKLRYLLEQKQTTHCLEDACNTCNRYPIKKTQEKIVPEPMTHI
jgi:hypothetical protein